MKVCPDCGTTYPDDAGFCSVDGRRLATGENPEAPMEAGRSLGTMLDDRYRLVEFLGAGGMGEVYRAEHVYIRKTVAVKLLRPDVNHTADSLARFHQEALSASSIGHRNIITIDDFGKLPDGTVYLTMEFLQGRTLAKHIASGPLEFHDALNLMLQISDGLAAAHAAGIIHRDMKPENVFLVPNEEGGEHVKILDFGIAKIHTAEGQNITKTGAICGTPHYMSPEQAMGEKLDPRADIYSLGIILFELVTGHVPFKSESFLGVLTQHLADEPPVPTHLRPDLPGSIERIILKALSKKREHRHQDMTEFMADLRAAQQQLVIPLQDTLRSGERPDMPVAPGIETAVNTSPENVPKPLVVPEEGVTSSKLVWFLPLLLLLAAAGTGLYFFSGFSNPSSVKEEQGETSLFPEQVDPGPSTTPLDCIDTQRPLMGTLTQSFLHIQPKSRKTWKAPCSGTDCGLSGQPVIARNTVFLGSRQSRLYAVDPHKPELRWEAELAGEVFAPLIWQDHVVAVSDGGQTGVFDVEKGTAVFLSSRHHSPFISAPFVARDRVWFSGADAHFHTVSQHREKFSLSLRRLAVRGPVHHEPVITGGHWFFAAPVVFDRPENVEYNLYTLLDEDSVSYKRHHKMELCVLSAALDQLEDPRAKRNCSEPNLLVDSAPLYRSLSPLVAGRHLWFFFTTENRDDGMVVVCDRSEERCRRIQRTGIASSGAAVLVNGRHLGVFATRTLGRCRICMTDLSVPPPENHTGPTCIWQLETPGCPGDLRILGDKLVFGTDRSRLVTMDVLSGKILQDLPLSGQVRHAVSPCANRLFIVTDNNTMDVFTLATH